MKIIYNCHKEYFDSWCCIGKLTKPSDQYNILQIYVNLAMQLVKYLYHFLHSKNHFYKKNEMGAYAPRA
jgi:hypothetical protein